ncbi:NUDIX hydrolase [Streptomyces qinzhouensis]|uniref:NUDIX hydrolase n=1 Tax=Streptomyces qinzhouensis TaxID=2599401 RepID=A0A5B8JJ70_9ACTN|nr:NUDIX hydrolase [Streptomyces qinzhouensis]QDY77543.1 NUDIX hydrolase [Streptomyces qinzhouensis]
MTTDPVTTPVALAVITSPADGSVLFVERRAPDGPRWVFPGGKAEHGETAEQTAVREAEQETGLIVAPVKRIGAAPHYLTGRYLIYIACAVVSGTAVPASPREVIDVAWVPTWFVDVTVPGIYEPVRRYLGLAPCTTP